MNLLPHCRKESLNHDAVAFTTYSWYYDAVWSLLMPMSGKEMLKLFLSQGWVILRQKGSHIALGKNGMVETIPMHRELAKGTEHALKKRLVATMRRDSK